MAGRGRANDRKGVYCLEGHRSGGKDAASVEPGLRLLETVSDPSVPWLHKEVATRAELEFRLRQWARPEFDSHPILYLAFDGRPGHIELGLGEGSLDLRELAALLEGACGGRVMQFGACTTLELHGNTLNRFMRRTGACALASYRSDVDRLSCSAFDLLLLGALQEVPFTAHGMRRVDRLLNETALGLRRKTGYCIDYDRARAKAAP